MQTLEQFYEFMDRLHTVRQAVTGHYLARSNTPAHRRSLQEALSALDDLPGGRLDKKLLAGEHEITVTVDYERGELEKDIAFLDGSDDEFADLLAERSELDDGAFAREVDETVRYLERSDIVSFITDRDGTVNNYCGRYRSSHQSIWNAVYLTRFVRDACDKPVILTSAPLTDSGLLSLSAMPSGSTVYAGSKGREYRKLDGSFGAMEIDDAHARTLDELGERVRSLLRRERYRAFGVIGSGFQAKFGEITVARQDIHRSIPEELSREFLDRVRRTVDDLDPDGSIFGVEDTGKDIEIILGRDGRPFSKGDGIRFLDERLSLRLGEGPNLVCGDTSSDLPMVETAVELGGATRAIFVTTDHELRDSVRRVLADAHFVSAPDVLVLALHRLAVSLGSTKESAHG